MNLARNFAKVGGATLLSRLLGFLRDILLAAIVGTGLVADAYAVAFRLPNLFRRLLPKVLSIPLLFHFWAVLVKKAAMKALGGLLVK